MNKKSEKVINFEALLRQTFAIQGGRGKLRATQRPWERATSPTEKKISTKKNWKKNTKIKRKFRKKRKIFDQKWENIILKRRPLVRYDSSGPTMFWPAHGRNFGVTIGRAFFEIVAPKFWKIPIWGKSSILIFSIRAVGPQFMPRLLWMILT